MLGINGGGGGSGSGWTASSSSSATATAKLPANTSCSGKSDTAPSSTLSNNNNKCGGVSRSGGSALVGGPYASLLLEDKKRQEELDKLLAGLDKLSETLPDLSLNSSSASATNGVNLKLKSASDEVRNSGDRLPIPQSLSANVEPRGESPDENNVRPSEIVSSLKRSANMANIATESNQQPYHARMDSKPFSYIRTMNGGSSVGNGSKPPSRTMSRASSKEALAGAPGLESPSILRKIINGSGAGGTGSRPTTPLGGGGMGQNGLRTTYSAVESVNVAMPLYSTLNKGLSHSNSTGSHLANGKSREIPIHKTSATILVNGSDNSGNTGNGLAPASGPGKSNLIKDMSHATDEEASLSWLQKQQMKLRERRDNQRRRESRERDGDMMKELKTSLTAARSGASTPTVAPPPPPVQTPLQAPAAVITTSTAPPRQMSPIRTFDVVATISPKQSFLTSTPKANTAQTPVNIPVLHTSNSIGSNISRHNIQQQSHFPSPADQHCTVKPQQQYGIPLSAATLLQRQKSDLSYDRGRPMMRRRYESECSNTTDGAASSYTGPPVTVTTYFGRNGMPTAEVTPWAGAAPSVCGSVTSMDSSSVMWGGAMGGGGYGTMSLPGSRPITPGFPSTAPTTPYFNQSANNFNIVQQRINSCHSNASTTTTTATRNGRQSPLGGGGGGGGGLRSASPAFTANTLPSRRGSITSLATSGEPPTEVPAQFVRRAKDSHKLWYKPTISRDEAVSALKNATPGSFLVRDSNSFPGAFGLALKVSNPPQGSTPSDPDELVRHFLIEPTKKGVKLKGYANEPVFASLSALIYQHTVTSLALPQLLVLPAFDLVTSSSLSVTSGKSDVAGSERMQLQQVSWKVSDQTWLQQLLNLGAACNVLYLFTMDTDSLTGPTALAKTVGQLMTLVKESSAPTSAMATCVHFKVSSQGITLTDNARRLFFRKHYNTHSVSFCGVDPEARKWKRSEGDKDGSAEGQGKEDAKIFGFVARKPTSKSGHNQCHLFAELDPDQPAKAIVNFVNKVLVTMGSMRGGGRSSRSLSARFDN